VSKRAVVVTIIVVAALLGLGAVLYGPVYAIPVGCLLTIIGIVELVGWMRRRRARHPVPGKPTQPPISHGNLKNLFEALDRPDPPDCTHTLAETEAFLKSHGLPVAPTLEWLKANGGFCDCEVIMNVADEWGEKVGWEPQESTRSEE